MNIPNENVSVISKTPDLVYYDNFKMFTSIIVDRIEVLSNNGTGFFGLKIKAEKNKDKEHLHFTLEAGSNQKLKDVLAYQDKFIEAVIKIIGGQYVSFEIDQMIKTEIVLPVRTKTMDELNVE